ncbi:MAG: molybdopterin molybdotransferase MoeA [Candidatus Omnitrophica bacterium]|nr:molybdopterin molybdotransferase MoeA [Candidatus Omnitrophota bacterium]
MTQAHLAAPRLTGVEEAKRIVLEQATTLGTERVRLEKSMGRVLAQDTIAAMALPPFDNSAMDGYAVRSADTAGASREAPIRLRLVGEVAAGRVLQREVGRGEAVKIMTGAPLPPGADSVVMLEEARLREGMVEIFADAPPGGHVRRAGEDIRGGEIALKAGTRIRFQHLGLLAGLGYATLAVYRRPTVALLATGSELVNIDEPLMPGKIRNSNSLVLAALLRRLGIEPVDLGTVIDERNLIRRQMEQAATCDVILISGGVSVGAHDLVKTVLREMGMETLFWRVNMKPGKPLLFGRLSVGGSRDRIVFGLPGNPISCVACFVVFIAPYLKRVTGESEPANGLVRARLTQSLRKKEAKTVLLTAQLREDAGTLVVAPTPQQGSGMLTSLAQANAFIVVPEDTMQLEAGSVVEVLPLGGDS